MQNLPYLVIILLGIATYGSAVLQMLNGQYSPSFFSRGVWFLLGIISFGAVLAGDGSPSAVLLAATLFIGNAAVFIVSYKKGSREFGNVEKISLLLLVVSVSVWLLLDSPFLGLIISLVAHFIGGIPTIWRTIKREQNERAVHWYFFFAACIITIISSKDRTITAILFPLYFAIFDGIIITLANRHRLYELLH